MVDFFGQLRAPMVRETSCTDAQLDTIGLALVLSLGMRSVGARKPGTVLDAIQRIHLLYETRYIEKEQDRDTLCELFLLPDFNLEVAVAPQSFDKWAADHGKHTAAHAKLMAGRFLDNRRNSSQVTP